MRRTTIISAATVAGLALAGCGSGAGGSSDKSARGVRTTIRAFLEDLKQGRGGDACDLMTPAARAQTGGGNPGACGARILLARAFLGQRAISDYEAKLGQNDVTITGGHATIPLFLGHGTARLAYSGGRWQIESNSS